MYVPDESLADFRTRARASSMVSADPRQIKAPLGSISKISKGAIINPNQSSKSHTYSRDSFWPKVPSSVIKLLKGLKPEAIAKFRQCRHAEMHMNVRFRIDLFRFSLPIF
jgi:hypothetical protein